jgi:transposase
MMVKSFVNYKGIKMGPRYEEEFKINAVKQVVENGYSIIDTASRLGMHSDSLRNWIKKYKSPEAIEQAKISDDANAEIKKLKKELKRVTEERDILKKAAAYFANQPS